MANIKLIEINCCPECKRRVYFRKKNKRYRCYYCNSSFKEPLVMAKGINVDKKKKRSIDDSDLITRNELLLKIKSLTGINQRRDRALISFLYLTAARIEEVVGLVNQYTRKRVLEPIKRHQIEFYTLDDKKYLVVNKMPILKRKMKNNTTPTRNVPIYIENEKPFVDYLKAWIDGLKPEQPLFKISYQRAWQISNKIILDEINDKRAFNHYFRHLRLTHLAENYGFQDLDLQQFVGWANSNMAAKYTHLNWQVTAKKMTRMRFGE